MSWESPLQTCCWVCYGFFRPHSLDNTHCVILSAFSWRREPNEPPKHTHFLLPYRFILLISDPASHTYMYSRPPPPPKRVCRQHLQIQQKEKYSSSSLHIIRVHPVCLLCWSMLTKFPGWEWWQKRIQHFLWIMQELQNDISVCVFFFFFWRRVDNATDELTQGMVLWTWIYGY